MRYSSALAVKSLAIAVALAAAAPAAAQPGFLARIFGSRLGDAQDGTYLAGDIRFEVERAGKAFLARFEPDPEIFVLYSDHSSLGGRILKYDSGETAIRVAGWGALTLYTDQQPNGLPAVRTGDAPPLSPAALSLQDVQYIAALEADRFVHARHMPIVFVVDWSVLETNAALRATASNALENAARGIDRFLDTNNARSRFVHRINAVTLATTGHEPALNIAGKTLVVTFNPERGYSGCASSRMVAHALDLALHASKKSS
jgi:uncharacterized protein DUF4908